MKRLVAIALAFLLCDWTHGAPSGVIAQRVQPLVQSVGVNTHVYQGGVYSVANIIADLNYLGVSNVRDYPLQYFSATNNYVNLAAAGVAFDFDLAGEGCNNNHIASLMPAWVIFSGLYPQGLASLEGMNEINNQPVCYLNTAATNATTANGNPTLHFAATLVSLQAVHSGGLDAGMTIVDTTTGAAIPGGTVQSSAAATTVTMSANAASSGVGSGDTITFEANAAQTNTNPANNAAGVAYQQDIYTQTHASLAGTSVINFTDCCSPVGVVGSADYNNFHPYPTFGLQPLGQLATYYSQSFVAGLGPILATETGYYTAGSTPGGSLIGTDGVDQLTQARYSLNDVMDLWNTPAPKSYLYELADEACDPGNTNAGDHYGLFDCSNNPKTAATALQNFHSILSDGGSNALTFTPGVLRYSVTGLPAPNIPGAAYGGYQLLFQKSNGTFEIIVWNEAFAWSHSTGDQTIAPTSVAVNLGSNAQTINVYDPVTSATPISTVSNASGVILSLAADMLIVEVIPTTAYTVTSPAYMANVKTGHSLPFTVALPSGTFNGSQTVTISDSGAGGTITPSVGSPGTSSVTVTPTNGSSSFTFTYANGTAGAYTLTFTNAQSWRNPSSVSYTTATAIAPYDGTTWSTDLGSYSTGVTHHTFHSNLMNVDIGYTIYVPPGYPTGGPFPVVYYFHGSGGNENELQSLGTYANVQTAIVGSAIKPMIVVGTNLGAADDNRDAQLGSPNYGTFTPQTTFINELIPTIDAAYSTIANKTGRALQGWSMGGQSCMRYATKFPQMFSSAYCMSPASDDVAPNYPICVPGGDCADVTSSEPTQLADLFNNNTAAWQADSVWGSGPYNATKINGLPIHVVVGSADPLINTNTDYFALLDSVGIAHDALTSATSCTHDYTCVTTFVGVNAPFAFASTHFP